MPAFAVTLAQHTVADVKEATHLFASACIHKAASKSKVSTLALAYKLPGFCHTHLPVDHLVPTCTYCRLHGNCARRD